MTPMARSPEVLTPEMPDGGEISWLATAGGVVLPFFGALALVPFRDGFANAAAALVLVAIVVAVASFGHRRAGWVASVSSAVWFDFFLTRPYERFTISSSHDIETTVSLLVVGAAVTEIAVRSRRHYVVARAEGNYLAVIRDLSDLVARGAPPGSVVEAARVDLIDLLGLDECRFEAGGAEAGRAQLLRNGEVELGTIRFDVARHGIPDGDVGLAVPSGDRTYGHYVMRAGEHHPVTIEQRIVALADQVGAALAAAPRTA